MSLFTSAVVKGFGCRTKPDNRPKRASSRFLLFADPNKLGVTPVTG
jgi:hypothetical protein